MYFRLPGTKEQYFVSDGPHFFFLMALICLSQCLIFSDGPDFVLVKSLIFLMAPFLIALIFVNLFV